MDRETEGRTGRDSQEEKLRAEGQQKRTDRGKQRERQGERPTKRNGGKDRESCGKQREIGGGMERDRQTKRNKGSNSKVETKTRREVPGETDRETECGPGRGTDK